MQPAPSSLRVEDLATTNEAMARCLRLAALAAKSDVPVVLLGETGTGKTLLAHAIHNSSARAARPLVSFNASAMSDTLLESQLFGHERGAFTGAQQAVKGKFELANDGTLFLDEISEMSPLAQVKILRVLEYGEFERLGSERMLKSNARMAELKAAAKSEGKTITAIHPQAMERLISYPWPGNLRELSHTVRTMTLFCDGPVILPQHVVFPPDLAATSSRKDGNQPEPDATKTNSAHANSDFSLASAVARHVSLVYEQTSRNQRQAARLLGISRATLARHLRKLNQK